MTFCQVLLLFQVVANSWIYVCDSTNDGFELATPVLLVDGYNMCGYWPKLKKHFARGNLEAARDKLIDELITFTHIKGNSRNNTLLR